MISKQELSSAIRAAANGATEDVDEFCSVNMADAAALMVLKMAEDGKLQKDKS